MSRKLAYCLITPLLWSFMSTSMAVPVRDSFAPQTGIGFSANQWKDSAVLRDAVEQLKRGDRPKAKTILAQFLKKSPNDPRGLELAGMILMEEKNYPVAVVSFERALALNPNNPVVLSKLGVSLLLNDRKKEGEEMLKRAIVIRPGEPLSRRYLGWLEEGRGNLDGAADHYLASLNGGDLPTGELTEIHLAVGRIYNTQGKSEQVVSLLAPLLSKTGFSAMDQAARFQLAYAYINLNRAEADPLIHSLENRLKPENPELIFLIAYAQIGSNPSGARAKLQALIKLNPAYAGRARFLVARSYALEGKTSLAAKELEDLAAQVEKDDLPEVLTALAAVHLGNGKPAEAANALEAFAKKNPESMEIAYLLAEVRFQMGDMASTQTLLKQVIARRPNHARAYALLGQVERNQNASPQAEVHLRKAVTLDGRLTNAWVNLASYYVARKELPKAEGALKQGLAANPGDLLLQYEIANFYDATGRSQDATPIYRAILASSPNNVQALSSFALSLAEGNDLAAAKKQAEKAYRIDNRNPMVQDAYGWILVLSEEPTKGLPLLAEAARSLPDDPAVLYHLGAALLKSGKTEEGKQFIQRSLVPGLPENLRVKALSLIN